MSEILDNTIPRIHQLASDEAINSAFRIASDDLNNLLLREVERPQVNTNNLYDHTVMLPFLESCRKVVEDKLKNDASSYSPLRWLWYFRRLPQVIYGEDLTKTIKIGLAELISGIAGRHGSTKPFHDDILAYEIHPSVINRVLKLFGGTDYLSRIYGLIRQAGLGVTFSFEKKALPIPQPSVQQQESMCRFDKRLALGGPPFNRLGTLVTSDCLHDRDMQDSVLMVYEKQKAKWTILGSPIGKTSDLNVYVRYLPQYHKLNELKALTSDPRLIGIQWWQEDAGALLLLLRLARHLLLSHLFCLAQLHQYGYFIIREQQFKEIANANIRDASEFIRSILPGINLPADADELLAILEQASGSLWPTPRDGPTIRREADLLSLDLFRATTSLATKFEFPRQDGAAPNARSLHFERTVQGIIDASPWSPSQEIRKRKLKFGGKVITDVDAIGAREDTLLLVDCYSTSHSAEYEIGKHTALCDIASYIEDKVIKWMKKKEFIAANPIGDNYDFSLYRKFIAVVCTPYPFYVPEGPATQLVAPELLAASALFELDTWLKGTR